MPNSLRHHLLPGRIPGPQDLGCGSAALTLSITSTRNPVPVRLLDSFDGTLHHSGRLLLESAGTLHLFGPRASLSQPAGGGGLVSELPEGPVQQVLKQLCPLRRLLTQAEGRLTRHNLRAARRGRPRGALTVYGVETPRGTASLLCSQLKGRKAAPALDRHLKALRAEPAAPAALFALLVPDRPRYSAKPVLPLSPGQPAHEAAGRILAAHLAAARQNEPGIISDLDTEFLHDYRIALRRIRALLSGLKDVLPAEDAARLRRDLKALMTQTNGLRDLDVWLLEQDRFRAMLPASLHPGLSALFAAIRARRAACQRELAARLGGAAYRWHMAGLTAEAAAARPQGSGAALPAGALARQLIARRHAKLCRAAARITAQSPDAEIHALRIGCKKLRYLMELFAPLFPAAELSQALKPLKRLQERLGRFNDCAQQQATLLELAARGLTTPKGKSDSAEAKAALAAGAMIALLHKEQQAARARLGERLDAFTSSAAQARVLTLCNGGCAAQAPARRNR
ncbi:CHAD domain-containing protein [Cribrihabitans pelagius]|uniref:CHAD domain-containing protein n=1 Tax=Cribrihabitans pelagius TaxID=1765746 RepID=UPI003B5A58CF